jgi:hypothetical protein
MMDSVKNSRTIQSILTMFILHSNQCTCAKLNRSCAIPSSVSRNVLPLFHKNPITIHRFVPALYKLQCVAALEVLLILQPCVRSFLDCHIIFVAPPYVILRSRMGGSLRGQVPDCREDGKELSHTFELSLTAYVQRGVTHFCVERCVCSLSCAYHKVHITVLGASECRQWH